MAQTLAQLQSHFAHSGSVQWIGLRPQKRADILEVHSANVTPEDGLVGDRYQGRDRKRQVTLIQFEHIAVMAALTGVSDLHPAMLRRNIAVSGINLLALKDKRFAIGGAVLEFTGLCHPCSHMETVLGVGGYNAMRGHGGINAMVIEGGLIAVGSSVAAIPADPAA